MKLAIIFLPIVFALYMGFVYWVKNK